MSSEQFYDPLNLLSLILGDLSLMQLQLLEADPLQFRISQVANSVYFVDGHASSNSSTF